MEQSSVRGGLNTLRGRELRVRGSAIATQAFSILQQFHNTAIKPVCSPHASLSLSPLCAASTTSSRVPLWTACRDKNSSRRPAIQEHRKSWRSLQLFVCILPLRGGLGGANVSFRSFLCARENGHLKLLSSRRRK